MTIIEVVVVTEVVITTVIPILVLFYRVVLLDSISLIVGGIIPSK